MNLALTILGILSMGFSFWQGTTENTGVMITAFLGALVFLFFGNLDRVSEIKASKDGFEAKTRDRISKAESDISDLKNLTGLIRNEIDSTPYFIHGRLPFVGQAILRYLHQGKPLDLDEFYEQMSHISSPKEIENIIAELRDQHGWINFKDGKISFTAKGEEAIKSYIELTMVRAF